jgi:preprotein translocase subunit SecE
MAKKTRAERKKQKQREQNNPNHVSKKEASVGAISDVQNSGSAQNKESVDKKADLNQPEVEKLVAAEPKLSDKQKAREEKEQQKRIARANKAVARDNKKKARTERRGPKWFWRMVDWFKSVRVEMKRVTWPSRNEVWRMSVIVVIALVFFGVIIYAVDAGVTPVLYALSGIGG